MPLAFTQEDFLVYFCDLLMDSFPLYFFWNRVASLMFNLNEGYFPVRLTRKQKETRIAKDYSQISSTDQESPEILNAHQN